MSTEGRSAAAAPLAAGRRNTRAAATQASASAQQQQTSAHNMRPANVQCTYITRWSTSNESADSRHGGPPHWQSTAKGIQKHDTGGNTRRRSGTERRAGGVTTEGREGGGRAGGRSRTLAARAAPTLVWHSQELSGSWAGGSGPARLRAWHGGRAAGGRSLR